MSEAEPLSSNSHATLDYRSSQETPPTAAAVRGVGFVVALLAATSICQLLSLCLQLYTMPYMLVGTSLLALKYYAMMAGAPAFLAIALAAIGRPQKESESGYFVWTCVIVGGEMIALTVFHCSLFFTARTNWKPPYIAWQVADQAQNCAVFLCMLLPAFLTRTTDRSAWQKRLLIGAAVVAANSSAFGVVMMVVGQDPVRALIAPFISGPGEIAFGVVGLWRISGLIAALLLCLAVWRPSRALVVAAVLLLTFASLGPFCVVARSLSSTGGMPANLLNWSLVLADPLKTAHQIAATLMPAVLAMATRRRTST